MLLEIYGLWLLPPHLGRLLLSPSEWVVGGVSLRGFFFVGLLPEEFDHDRASSFCTGAWTSSSSFLRIRRCSGLALAFCICAWTSCSTASGLCIPFHRSFFTFTAFFGGLTVVLKKGVINLIVKLIGKNVGGRQGCQLMVQASLSNSSNN